MALSVLNIAGAGDEIVSGSGIFGGTHSLFNSLKQFGIMTRFAKDSGIHSFEECLSEKTKCVYVETLGNPKLDVADLSALSSLAHERGIPLIVDNTATTPYLIKPFEFGADIVVHSTSKFINGNGTAVGGVIVDCGNFKWDFDKYGVLKQFAKFGPFAYLAKLRNGFYKDMGPCMAPFTAFLNNIGLETLGLRMERLCSNSLELARFLYQSGKVKDVNYPGLKKSPYHDLARKQFGDKYGAILTIRLGSKGNAFKLIDNLKYAMNVSNIGDNKTLVIHPASTIFNNLSSQERESAGVYDDLVRISVGIEDIEDIIEDFDQALDKL